jgi:hypothetical protein
MRERTSGSTPRLLKHAGRRSARRIIGEPTTPRSMGKFSPSRKLGAN